MNVTKPKLDLGPGSQQSPIWARFDVETPGYENQKAIAIGLGSALDLAERLERLIERNLRGERHTGDCILIRIDADGLRADVY